jgi:hypothetical protein
MCVRPSAVPSWYRMRESITPMMRHQWRWYYSRGHRVQDELCVSLDVPHMTVHRHRHEMRLQTSVTKENGIHDKGIG